jgi:hypothetical protein
VSDIERLSALRQAVEAAQARSPSVREHNRRMKLVDAECQRLAATPDGRTALEQAASSDRNPMLRISAATTVAAWAPAHARVALEELVRASGGEIARPMTMSAALAVHHEPGHTAALCLFNLDRGGNPERQKTTPHERSAAVPSHQLDAAERVYSLTMNGGLDHAYEVAGNDFGAAADALDRLGLGSAGGILREVMTVIGRPSAHRNDRRTAVGRLSDEQVDVLEELSARFQALPDVMDRLESAVEG